MKIGILGCSTTKFGELWDRSPRSLAQETVTAALDDAQLPRDQIDALFVGNMLSGILGNQENLGAFFAAELGLNCPAFKVEGACASGGLAVHLAVNGLLSDQYRRVLVLGIEKMTDFKPEETTAALMGAGSDEERSAGLTFPGLYALLARAHMQQYGTTEKDLAAVSVKNHYHASLNPLAQYPRATTIEAVLDSTPIADPLKLLDCSPISDGAAAVILGQEQVVSAADKTVWITGSAVATDTLGLAERENLTTLAATRKAAHGAYKQAHLGPADIAVAEVHDCFSIAEVLAMEDLEFYAKGAAAAGIAKQETMLGKNISGKPVVNTSGGLKACGHPVGATGVKQIVELATQLRGAAGARQVVDAHTGLAHNVGGSGAVAVVHVLQT